MNNSLQTKLFRAFIVVIAVFAMVGVGVLGLNRYVVQQYKQVSDHMITEYQLSNAVSELITAYNTRFFLGTTTASDRSNADKQVLALQSQITTLTKQIDAATVDPQARVDFAGLKNSISDVLAETNAGLATLDKNDLTNASAHYQAANTKYDFVTQNSTTLIFDELKHAAVVQGQINATYKATSIIAGVMGVLVLGCALTYAYIFARRLIVPLQQLTMVASTITAGNLETQIDAGLLAPKDEVGSLSRSFSLMLTKLKGYIQELNQEKASVERKVEQRTAELSEEKARLAASVNSLSLGFIMTDADNKLLMINDQARMILSYEVDANGVSKLDETEQQRPWSVQDIETRLKEHFVLDEPSKAKAGNGQPRTIERKDIEYHGRILRFFLAPIVNRGAQQSQAGLGSVVLLEDITEEKVQQRSKDEFFSIASHELRTPLTAIRGNASMMGQLFGPKLNDKDFDEMLGDIHGSSVRLIELVNDFLDTSRLEQGKIGFRLEPFTIDEVMENVIYETGAVSKEKHNHIVLEDKTRKATPAVYADKDRVKQVAYNLIGNAMKFTENGTITVSYQVQDDLLKVLVEDSGGGISEQNQKLLFHKFQQAGDSLLTRDTSKGTGLGLYISKLLVEKMGGKITLERSVVGKGSIFSFTLPLATPEQLAAPKPAA